jgi:hypothetical protein
VQFPIIEHKTGLARNRELDHAAAQR